MTAKEARATALNPPLDAQNEAKLQQIYSDIKEAAEDGLFSVNISALPPKVVTALKENGYSVTRVADMRDGDYDTISW